VSHGLSYKFYAVLEKPARNLTITPVSPANGIKFVPKTIAFNDFETDVMEFTLIVTSEVLSGDYDIKFIKDEDDSLGIEYYMNILDFKLSVIPFDPLFNAHPFIRVLDAEDNSAGYPITVPIRVEIPPANEIQLLITIVEE